MENQRITKEQRHQQAKLKYKNYQRNFSSKHLNNKKQDVTLYVPKTGSYAIFKSNNSQKHNASLQNSHIKNLNQLKQTLPKLNPSNSAVSLTKNLNEIVKNKGSSPFDSVMHEISCVKGKHKLQIKRQQSNNRGDKRNMQENNEYFKRPISAKIYKQMNDKKQDNPLEMIKKLNMHEGQKITKKKSGSYFSRKLDIPKHVYGYKTINLKNSKNIYFQPNQLQKNQQIVFDSLNINYSHLQRKFLPIQYYLLEHDIQNKNDKTSTETYLMRKYRNQNDGLVKGFSKWQYTNGKSVWRKCIVEGYDKNQERWIISWVKEEQENKKGIKNNQTKKVSRNNLCFEGQNFNHFSAMIQNAQKFRKSSQIYLKYNTLIDLMQSQTSHPSSSAIIRIKKLVKQIKKQTYDQNMIEELLKQAENVYIRAQHQFQLNMSLPYNQKYKQAFSNIIPDYLFDPNPRKVIQNSINNKNEKSSKITRKIFNKGLKLLKQKSFINSKKKLEILEFINAMGEQFLSNKEQAPTNIYRDYTHVTGNSFSNKYVYELEQLDSLLARNMQNFIFNLNHKICDIEYMVSKEIDPIYQNRKLIPKQQLSDVYKYYAQFCKVINSRIETIVKESCLKIFKLIFHSISSSNRQNQAQNLDSSKIINSEIQIMIYLQLEANKLVAKPSIQKFKNTIQNRIMEFIRQLMEIKCVSKAYLPQIRPNNHLNIGVSQNLAEFRNKLNEIKNQQYSQIMVAYNMLDRCLEETLQNFKIAFKKIEQKVNVFTEYYLQVQKKIGKKFIFIEIEQLVNKIISLRSQFAQILCLNYQKMNSASIVIDYQNLKYEIPHKIQSLLLLIAKNIIIQKVHRDNDKLEKAIDKYFVYVEKVPSSIQQFIQLQEFLTVQLLSQIKRIKIKCLQIQQKLKIVDCMGIQTALNESDFQKCYKPYFKIVRLSEFRQNLILKIDEAYRKKFIEEVVKQRMEINQSIIELQLNIQKCLKHKSLVQMDSSFNLYLQNQKNLSSLAQRCKTLVNHEMLLKILNREQKNEGKDSSKIQEIAQQEFPKISKLYKLFWMPDTLLSLYKNFRQSILPLLEESVIHPLQAQNPSQTLQFNIRNSLSQLEKLKNIRQNNQQQQEFKISISRQWNIEQKNIAELIQQYQQFSKFLSLIAVFRSQYLRDRHWKKIQDIILSSMNQQFQSCQISQNPLKSLNLKQVLDTVYPKDCSQAEQVKKGQMIEKKILKISKIAIEEFIHQKKLNQMKRQWKDVKVSVCKNGNIRCLEGIDQISEKVQNDCIQIQKILESPFINFLRSQINQWKQSTINKIHEFIQLWPSFQKQIHQKISLKTNKIYPLLQRIDQSNDKNRGQFTKLLDVIQKQYISFMTNIQFQSHIIDIVNNPKTDQYLIGIYQNISILQNSVNQILLTLKNKNHMLLGKFINNTDFFNFDIQQTGLCGNWYLFKGVERCWNVQKVIFQTDQSDTSCLNVKICNKIGDIMVVKIKLSKEIGKTIEQVSQCIILLDQFTRKVDIQIRKSIKEKMQNILKQGQIYSSYYQVVKAYLGINFTLKVQKTITGPEGASDFNINKQFQTLQSDLLSLKHKTIKQIMKIQSEQFKSISNIYKTSLIGSEIDNQICILKQLEREQIYDKNEFGWQKNFRIYQEAGNQKVIKIKIVNKSHNFTYQLINNDNFKPYQKINHQRELTQMILPLFQGPSLISNSSTSMIFETYQRIGAIYGRSVFSYSVLKANDFTEQLEQIFKLAAEGVFVVLKNMEFITKNQAFLFEKCTQLLQIQTNLTLNQNRYIHKDHKLQVFDINGKQMIVQPTKFWLTGISKNCSEFESFRRYYRNISLVKMPVSKQIKLRLDSLGLIKDEDKMTGILNYTDIVVSQLRYKQNYEQFNKQKEMPELRRFNIEIFGSKLDAALLLKIKQLRQKQQCQISQESIQKWISQFVADFIDKSFNHQISEQDTRQNIEKFNYILSKLRILPPNLKNAKMYKLETQQIQQEQYNTNKIHTFSKISECLQSKSGVILLNSESFNSQVLVQNFDNFNPSYIVTSIYPTAYFKDQLYGSINNESSTKGILKLIVNQLRDRVQIQKDKLGVLHIKSVCYLSQQIQMLRQYSRSMGCDKIRLVTSVNSIDDLCPCDLEMCIIPNWQQINLHELAGKLIEIRFYKLLDKNDNKPSLNQIKVYFKELVEPLLEFYVSLLNTSRGKQQKIDSLLEQKSKIKDLFENQISINFSKIPFIMIQPSELIRKIIQLSCCLFTQYQNNYKQIQSQQNDSDAIINVFYYSSLTILGYTLPDDFRKLLSRHLRYILHQIDFDIFSKLKVSKPQIFSDEQGNTKGFTIHQIYNNRMKQQDIYDYFYCPKKNCWINSTVFETNIQNNILYLPEYTNLKRYLMMLCQFRISAFLVGQPHSSKSQMFKQLFWSNYRCNQNCPLGKLDELDFKPFIDNEKIQLQMFPCSRYSKKSKILVKIQESLCKYGLSKKNCGIANYKTNLYYVQDLSMDYISEDNYGSIREFILQLLSSKGCYIQSSPYLFTPLQNILVYGTISISSSDISNFNNESTLFSKFSNLKKISKNSSLIMMPIPQKRVESILSHKLTSTLLNNHEIQRLVRCTINFYDSLTRQFVQTNIIGQNLKAKDKSKAKAQMERHLIINFQKNDMVKAIEIVTQIINGISAGSETNQIQEKIQRMGGFLRIWAYSIQKAYDQKIISNNKENLFYFLNNTLMEQERLRYKQIVPDRKYFILKQCFNQTKSTQYSSYTIQSLTIKMLQTQIQYSNKFYDQDNKFMYLYWHNSTQGHKICYSFLTTILKIWSVVSLNYSESKIILIFNEQRIHINSLIRAVSLYTNMFMCQPRGQISKFKQEPDIDSIQNGLQLKQMKRQLRDLKKKYQICKECMNCLNQLKTAYQNQNSKQILPLLILLSQDSPYIYGKTQEDKLMHKICQHNLFESLTMYQKMGLVPNWILGTSNNNIEEDQPKRNINYQSIKIIINLKQFSKLFISNYSELVQQSSFIYLRTNEVRESEIYNNKKIVSNSYNTEANNKMVTEVQANNLTENESELQRRQIGCKFDQICISENALQRMLECLDLEETENKWVRAHSLTQIYLRIKEKLQENIREEDEDRKNVIKMMERRVPQILENIKNIKKTMEQNLKNREEIYIKNVTQKNKLQPIFFEEQKKYNHTKNQIQFCQNTIDSLTLQYQHKIRQFDTMLIQNSKKLTNQILTNYQSIQKQVLKFLSKYDEKTKWVLKILSILVQIPYSDSTSKSLPKKIKENIKVRNTDERIQLIQNLGDPKMIKKLKKLSLKSIGMKSMERIMDSIESKQQKGFLEQKRGQIKSNGDKFLKHAQQLVISLIKGLKLKVQCIPIEEQIEKVRSKLQKKKKQLKKIQGLKSDKKLTKSQQNVKYQTILKGYKCIFDIFQHYANLCREQQKLRIQISHLHEHLSIVTQVCENMQKFMEKDHLLIDIAKEYNQLQKTQTKDMSRESLKMAVCLQFFDILRNESHPIGLVQKIIRKMYNQQQQLQQIQINQNCLQQIQQLNKIMKNCLKNYKGIVLHQSSQQKTQAQMEVENQESLQNYMLKNTWFSGKYEQVDYYSFIKSYQQFQELFNSSKKMRQQQKLGEYSQISQQYNKKYENGEWQQEYYKTNDKNTYWKKQKNLQIQKNLINTLLEVNSKNNSHQQCSTDFKYPSNNYDPLIIKIPTSNSPNLIYQKTQQIFKIIEKSLYNFHHYSNTFNKDHFSFPSLKNRLIVLSAASFKQQVISLYPYISFKKNQVCSLVGINLLQKCSMQYQYNYILSCLSKMLIQHNQDQKQRQCVKQQKILMVKRILKESSRLYNDSTEIDIRINELSRQVCNCEIYNAQNLKNSITKLQKMIIKLEHLSSLFESEQSQIKQRQENTSEIEVPKKLQKICLYQLLFYKIITYLSNKSGFKPTLPQFHHFSIQNLLITNKYTNQIKATKNQSIQNLKILKIQKQILPSLYDKYSGILLNSTHSQQALSIFIVGVSCFPQTVDFSISKISLFISLFISCLRLIQQNQNSEISKLQDLAKIEQIHQKYYSQLYSQQKQQQQITPIQISQIIQKHIEKFIQNNQYPWQPYLVTKNQKKPTLLRNIPKILIAYLVMLLKPDKFGKCIQSAMNNKMSKSQRSYKCSNYLSKWFMSRAYNDLQKQVIFFKINQPSIPFIADDIFKMSKHEKFMVIPLSTNTNCQNDQSIKKANKKLTKANNLHLIKKKNQKQIVDKQKKLFEGQMQGIMNKNLNENVPLIFIEPKQKDVDLIINLYKKFKKNQDQVQHETSINTNQKETSQQKISQPKIIFMLRINSQKFQTEFQSTLIHRFPIFALQTYEGMANDYRENQISNINSFRWGYKQYLYCNSKHIFGIEWKNLKSQFIEWLKVLIKEINEIVQKFKINNSFNSKTVRFNTPNEEKLRIFGKRLIQYICYKEKQSIMKQRGKKNRIYFSDWRLEEILRKQQQIYAIHNQYKQTILSIKNNNQLMQNYYLLNKQLQNLLKKILKNILNKQQLQNQIESHPVSLIPIFSISKKTDQQIKIQNKKRLQINQQNCQLLRKKAFCQKIIEKTNYKQISNYKSKKIKSVTIQQIIYMHKKIQSIFQLIPIKNIHISKKLIVHFKRFNQVQKIERYNKRLIDNVIKEAVYTIYFPVFGLNLETINVNDQKQMKGSFILIFPQIILKYCQEKSEDLQIQISEIDTQKQNEKDDFEILKKQIQKVVKQDLGKQYFSQIQI